MKKLSIAAITATLALNISIMAQDAPKPAAPTLPPASTKTNVTFAADIKPMFDTACGKCHGAEKPAGGIQLNTLENTLKGARGRKILTPGDGSKGMLINSVAHIGNPESFMPKRAKQLTPEQIGLIRAWIDQGAK